MKNTVISMIGLSTLLAACGGAPVRDDALELARSRISAARADTRVMALAPEELGAASKALLDAEAAAKSRRDKTTIAHLSYLATQRVTIAEETAASRTAQALTAGAATKRDQMRLDLRTAEADASQRQLVAAQQSNAAQATALAVATERSDARVSDLESQLAAMNAKNTDRGVIVTLGDVLFDTGKASLRGGGDKMAALADFFRRNPERRATIEGHTDNVGSARSNYALAERRANSVEGALLGMGVAEGQLHTRSYGPDMPSADNGTAAGRQMNRRVEIVFAPRSEDIGKR